MTSAQLSNASSAVASLGSALAALSGLSGNPYTVQLAVVLAAGPVARQACWALACQLLTQREANARAAIAAVLNLTDPPPLGLPLQFAPIEAFSPSVQALTVTLGQFEDPYDNQSDRGLASYALMASRFTALSALCSSEPGLIVG